MSSSDSVNDMLELRLADASKVKIHAPANEEKITIQAVVKCELECREDYHSSCLMLNSQLSSLLHAAETWLMNLDTVSTLFTRNIA